MVEGKSRDPKALRLELTVPCDARSHDVLAAMSQKMATYVGYAAGEATEVAEALARATDGVLEDDGTSVYSAFDVTFDTSEQGMAIRVRYICAESDATGPGIERLLNRGRDGDVPLALMQRVMHTVEFGHDDGVEFCIFTKLLPEMD